jgi:transposase
MSFDVTNVMELHEPVVSKEVVGIDVGIKDMAITSDGNKFQVQIKRIKMLEDKVSKIQKSISRKQLINKGSFNSGNYKRLLERKGTNRNLESLKKIVPGQGALLTSVFRPKLLIW